MIVRPADAERFVARPPAGIAAVLLYGPNRGLVEDRGARLGRTVAEALDDPFRVADLAPAAVAADPAALVDEAAALSLTGGRRLVRLRGAGNETAAACEALLERAAPGGSLVVVEAGDLNKRARLRTLFERAETGAALACYEDDRAALAGAIRDRLAAHGKTAAAGAREVLLSRLGTDRRAALSELDKLALYAGDAREIDERAALACVGDSAEATLDALADAVAAGDGRAAGRAFDRLDADGVHPVRILSALQRHFQALSWAAARMGRGDSAASAVAAMRPPVFFKRRRAVAGQLARWTAADLGRALNLLLDAEIQCKTTGTPARLICSWAALRITRAARR